MQNSPPNFVTKKVFCNLRHLFGRGLCEHKVCMVVLVKITDWWRFWINVVAALTVRSKHDVYTLLTQPSPQTVCLDWTGNSFSSCGICVNFFCIPYLIVSKSQCMKSRGITTLWPNNNVDTGWFYIERQEFFFTSSVVIILTFYNIYNTSATTVLLGLDCVYSKWTAWGMARVRTWKSKATLPSASLTSTSLSSTLLCKGHAYFLNCLNCPV